MKKREYLFDNYKVLLIVLVVIGHFIEPCYDQNPFLYELKWAIVAFHMPAFIFISGYFSKRTPSLKKLVKGLVIPYFVYEIAYYVLYTVFLGKSTGLYFDRPKFTLWYLMALFVWRILTPFVRKIPYYMPLTIIAGLLVGLTDLGNLYSIPRIVFFFPFFLAGVAFDSECLKKYRTERGYAMAVAVVGMMGLMLFTDNFHRSLSTKIFYGRYSYAELGLGSVEGIVIRLVCYGISFLLVYLLMLIIPSEKKRFSYMGERTMPIYIFHGMIYSCFKYGTDLLTGVRSGVECVILLAFCFALAWLLARPPFVAITNRVSNLI